VSEQQLSLDAELEAADGQSWDSWFRGLPADAEPARVRPKLTPEQRRYLKLEVDRRRREQLAGGSRHGSSRAREASS
jgi:hypothetical protein